MRLIASLTDAVKDAAIEGDAFLLRVATTAFGPRSPVIGGAIMGAISSAIDVLKPMVAAVLTEVARVAIPMMKAAVNFQQLGMDIGSMIVSGLAQGIWAKMMEPIDAIKGLGKRSSIRRRKCLTSTARRTCSLTSAR